MGDRTIRREQWERTITERAMGEGTMRVGQWGMGNGKGNNGGGNNGGGWQWGEWLAIVFCCKRHSDMESYSSYCEYIKI